MKAFLLLISALCLSESVSAQSTDDSIAVRVAAIKHLKAGELRQDTLVLDSDDAGQTGHSHGIRIRRGSSDRARTEAANRAIQARTSLSLSQLMMR